MLFTTFVPEGCSPGYWRNHFDQWVLTGLDPDDNFWTVFGYPTTDLDFEPPTKKLSASLTLGIAINLGGGGYEKLARHGTAALLNARAGLAYPYSESIVIQMVQTGMETGSPGEPEATLLADANSIGCPLP